MYIDGVNYKNIMMIDKTRVVYHKDKGWKQKLLTSSGTTVKDEVKKTNIAIGEKMLAKLQRKKKRSAQAIADELRKD